MHISDLHLDVLAMDANPVLASGSAMLLAGEGGIRAEARTIENSTLPDIDPVVPLDIVILDPDQFSADTAQLAAALQSHHPDLRLVAYCDGARVDLARDCLQAGFRGIVSKQSPFEVLLIAVAVVAQGGLHLDAGFARALSGFSVPLDTARQERRSKTLSERELFVLKATARGMSLKEIGHALDLSVKTVETYKARGSSKLNLSSRREIVEYAIWSGWVQ